MINILEEINCGIKRKEEEIEKRKRRIERAEAIGLSIMHVTSEWNYDEEYENPYAVEALRYILNDMDVPEEVKVKMKVFDEKNKKQSESD